MKEKLFSGIQPSGEIHLGNYLGAIKNWVDLQEKYQCFFAIVDYHAITVNYEPKKFKEKIFKTAATLLACGIDPQKSIFFIQSRISEHTELAWLLNTLTPLSELKRMTQFKDKIKRNPQNINTGLLNYPILQAADILLYKAIYIPIGEDQLQHIELTRKITKKFNLKFGHYFTEPEPIITKLPRVMSLTEPQKKMSKSHSPKSYIALTDNPEIIKRKIMGAVTDIGPQFEKKISLGTKNLFDLLNYFTEKKIVEQFKKEYQDKTIKYSELKNILSEAIIETLAPIQEKRKKIMEKPEQVWKILEKGEKKAQKIAKENIKEIKEKMGLLY